jgi:hypothetical protein
MEATMIQGQRKKARTQGYQLGIQLADQRGL